MKRIIAIVALLVVSLPLIAKLADDQARLLRFPTIGGGKIVFSYAGNLYSVNEDGGEAKKLTSHVGYESFPKISPDGKTIAFTGQYDGNTEVYTIPIEGGEPKRLTYSASVSRDQVGERMGPNNIVMGWTPNGKEIVYRSKQHTFSGLRGELCRVSVNGGVPTQIPTTEGGFCSYSLDGKYLAMNRMFREFRTWKYYRGGQADDIWINTVGTTKLENITNNNAQDIFPMWAGDNIFYLSDRDHIMNLFVYNTKSKETKKVTDFTEYDCKFPSHSAEAIVFENGGYIYKYDIKAGSAKQIPITLKDDNIYSRTEYRDMSNAAASLNLSPKGDKVLSIIRGDIFLLPVGDGAVYNISNSPQSHEREPRWSPKGDKFAYISDISGEYQIYVANADTPTKGEQLTNFKNGYPQRLQWSPDNNTLYFLTEKRDVYSLNVSTKELDRILVSEGNGIGTFSLSPDGTWVAYTDALENFVSAVFLYNFKEKKSYKVTDRWWDASSPIFSRDGKYLFFKSSREFSSQFSMVEWNAIYRVSEYIFVVPLTESVPNPVTLSPMQNVAADKKQEGAVVTLVDTKGIVERVTPLPLPAAFYRLNVAKDGKLYYMEGLTNKVFDLKTLTSSNGATENALASNVDYTKSVVRSGGKLKVTPFGIAAKKDAPEVVTAGAIMQINHKEEWKQIYNESWRITRDGFYVENMHGADWDKIRDKYGVMLPYVNHRDDLSYLIGEMIGELNVGHAYITSGESPNVSKIATGLLGARYSKDKSGAFKIEKIYKGANWDKSLRSPLTEPGVNAKVGEYIIAVNGIDSKELLDVNQALIGKVGKTVSLTLASNAAGKESRVVYVKPIADESQLAYYEWVQNNIAKVEKLSNGEIGYIHIPDMSTKGLDMFTKLFYTQLDKKALIIDDRMNGGGNVSPIILERLKREVYRMSMYRNGANRTVPNEAHYGPKVCLIDKYSSSDGDLFPYGFRKLGLGKIIGKRSWGGIVGISGSKQFVDGQDMRTPFFTSYSTDGEWIIEGHGVDPDIEVDINPFEDFLGKDAQLEKAVEYLKEELKNYKPLPSTPADPVRLPQNK